jgi:hypothetical protein
MTGFRERSKLQVMKRKKSRQIRSVNRSCLYGQKKHVDFVNMDPIV